MEQKYSRSGYPSDHRKQITAYVFHLPQFTLDFVMLVKSVQCKVGFILETAVCTALSHAHFWLGHERLSDQGWRFDGHDPLV